MTSVPVFPLNAVLFPGVVAPLHIFEDRYRALMRDLLEIPDPARRVFAVVAIREGYEVGTHGRQSLHRIGTLVQLTEIERDPEGRFDIEVTGRQRIRLERIDTTGEYLRAETERLEDLSSVPGWTADELGDEADRTLATFEEYRDQLSELRGGPVLAGTMPADPTYLSYALAATCLLSLGERQSLLEAADTGVRLQQLRHALREEMRAMRALPSLPATEVARTRWSPN